MDQISSYNPYSAVFEPLAVVWLMEETTQATLLSVAVIAALTMNGETESSTTSKTLANQKCDTLPVILNDLCTSSHGQTIFPT